MIDYIKAALITILIGAAFLAMAALAAILWPILVAACIFVFILAIIKANKKT